MMKSASSKEKPACSSVNNEIKRLVFFLRFADFKVMFANSSYFYHQSAEAVQIEVKITEADFNIGPDDSD